jgi:hypothetical protein
MHRRKPYGILFRWFLGLALDWFEALGWDELVVVAVSCGDDEAGDLALGQLGYVDDLIGFELAGVFRHSSGYAYC